MNLSRLKRAVAARYDAWVNTLTQVGTSFGKNDLSFEPQSSEYLDLATLEYIYNLDGIGARIVDSVPKHALRKGFKVSASSNDVETLLQDEFQRLHFKETLKRAWTWARLYGGGAVFLGVDDGSSGPEEPLRRTTLRRVLWATDVDRRELYPMTFDTDPWSPRFGMPVTYRLTRIGGTASDTVVVHASRLLRFEGITPTRRRRLQLYGWGESILQRVISELKAFRGAFAASGVLLQEASQGVIKIRGLHEAMASDGDKAFSKRLALMEQARSVARALLLDADGEDYSRVDIGVLSGVADLLDRNANLLSAVSEVPVTVLMGQAPAGLNATGDSDIENWHASIGAEREDVLPSKIAYVAKLLLSASEGPTRGSIPAGIKVTFPPFKDSSEHEEAKLRATQATTDKIYMDAGVLRPDEVRQSRFRPEGWSETTSLTTDPATQESSDPGSQGPRMDIQATALNGAQTATLVQIVQAVAAGGLSRESGLALIKISTPTATDEMANAALGPVDFKPLVGPDGKPLEQAPSSAQTADAALVPQVDMSPVSGIIEQVASRRIPRRAGIAQIAHALGVDEAKAEALLGPEYYTAPEPQHAAEMERMRAEHAAAIRSQKSTKSMLQRVLAENREGRLWTGIQRGADDPDTQEETP